MTKKELLSKSNYELHLENKVKMFDCPYNEFMFKGYKNVTCYVDKKRWEDFDKNRHDEWRRTLYEIRYRLINVVVVYD